MKTLAILGVSGSLRKESTNTKALMVAMETAKNAGAEVEILSLNDLSLPIYNEDMENGDVPESVRTLRDKVKSCDMLIIASPEYNHSISGALKNAIDWASREGNAFDGKVAAIFGASDGRFGTVRGQRHLREILAALNVLLLPQPQVFITYSKEAFNEDGSFKDPKTKELLDKLILSTINLVKKLKG
jgi:NAD(P)H-dependent FMN reductase